MCAFFKVGVKFPKKIPPLPGFRLSAPGSTGIGSDDLASLANPSQTLYGSGRASLLLRELIRGGPGIPNSRGPLDGHFGETLPPHWSMACPLCRPPLRSCGVAPCSRASPTVWAPLYSS